MTRLRRGFKAEAERLSLEVRDEVGAGPYQRLDPADVAEVYGIPLVDLSLLACEDAASLDGDVSALTVVQGTRRLIVVNDVMSPVRQRSAVAHELAHLLLEHAPTVIGDGERQWQPTAEAEADWLGGCLLAPKGAAIGCASAGMSDRAVAGRYGTSVALARWRMNVTAARLIARRTRASGSGAAAS